MEFVIETVEAKKCVLHLYYCDDLPLRGPILVSRLSVCDERRDWPSDHHERRDWPSDHRERRDWPSDHRERRDWPSDHRERRDWPAYLGPLVVLSVVGLHGAEVGLAVVAPHGVEAVPQQPHAHRVPGHAERRHRGPHVRLGVVPRGGEEGGGGIKKSTHGGTRASSTGR